MAAFLDGRVAAATAASLFLPAAVSPGFTRFFAFNCGPILVAASFFNEEADGCRSESENNRVTARLLMVSFAVDKSLVDIFVCFVAGFATVDVMTFV
jgi:hypothetical protein